MSLLASGFIAVGGASSAHAAPPADVERSVAAGGNLNWGPLPLDGAATESVTVTLNNADTATTFKMSNDSRNDPSTKWPLITLSAVESGTLTVVETSTKVITLVFEGIDTASVLPGYSLNGTNWYSMTAAADSSTTLVVGSPTFRFGVDSVTVWTKNLGRFVMHKISLDPGASFEAQASSDYLTGTDTLTVSMTSTSVAGTYTFTQASPSTCTVSGGTVTGVETTTPASICIVGVSRAADSVTAQLNSNIQIAKFSAVSAAIPQATPLVAQIPVNWTVTGVESATITMLANSLETDTVFTLTPLAQRSSARAASLPSFRITAVDSATGTHAVTQFLKPVRIDLPNSDTITAKPAYKSADSDTWTVIVPGDSATVLTMADTASATTYETSATGFIIWTRHMTSFGSQDAQDTLTVQVSSASLTVGGATATASLKSGEIGTGGGTLTYASSNTAVCTVNASSGVVTPVAAGNCDISATRAATDTYMAKTSNAVTVTVAAAQQQNNNTGGGGGAPPIVSTGVGSITGTASYETGGTVKCEAPVYSQTPSSVKFTWSGIASGTLTVTTTPWLANITIPAKTDGTLNCEILATTTGSTASSQVTYKIDKPAPAPTPVVTPTPEPTPTPVAKTQYKIKCVKWNKKVSGPTIRYKTGNNPKCWAGYRQTARTKVS